MLSSLCYMSQMCTVYAIVQFVQVKNRLTALSHYIFFIAQKR